MGKIKGVLRLKWDKDLSNRQMCAQTGFDIAKALPIGQLCKRHAEILVETTKPFYIPFALVALHATPERVHWQVIGHLGKNELARIRS